MRRARAGARRGGARPSSAAVERLKAVYAEVVGPKMTCRVTLDPDSLVVTGTGGHDRVDHIAGELRDAAACRTVAKDLRVDSRAADKRRARHGRARVSRRIDSDPCTPVPVQSLGVTPRVGQRVTGRWRHG
jgi:hypothetical protein